MSSFEDNPSASSYSESIEEEEVETIPEPDKQSEQVISVLCEPSVDNVYQKPKVAGQIALIIVAFYCSLLSFCVWSAIVLQFVNVCLTVVHVHNVSKNINKDFNKNISSKDVEKIVKSNNQAIETIDIIRTEGLNNSGELFRNVGALTSVPLGLVLGFYFRESSSD